MKVTINMTKKEMNDLRYHTFSDCCGHVWYTMIKIQKEIRKIHNFEAKRVWNKEQERMKKKIKRIKDRLKL